MSTVVIKWGGSVLQSAADVRRLADTVACYKGRRVVVVSALYGVTDTLERALHTVPNGSDAIAHIVEELRHKHDIVIREAGAYAEQAQRAVEERLTVLTRYLSLADSLGYVPPDIRDAVLSHGERLISAIVTAVLQHHGTDVQEALPEDIGLITDGRYGNADVVLDKARYYIQRAVTDEKIYIVPGFYGVTSEGRITVLGRGGSDYSAAAIAYCLDAESADFYKDVPGFMSADPKQVADAVAIPVLNYDEAAELTYFGAKILHPQAVALLKHSLIPAHVYNVRRFKGIGQKESVIQADSASEGVLKSVAATDDCAVVRFSGGGVGVKPGILADITGIFSRAEVNIKTVLTSLTTINVLIASKDVPRCRHLFDNERIQAVEDIHIDDDISLVAVVGDGINERHGVIARLLKSLSEKEINVRLLSAGASPCAIYVIVRRSDRKEAVLAAHSALFVALQEVGHEKR